MQTFPAPSAAPAGEASSSQTQDTLPGQSLVPGGFPPGQEGFHSLPKVSSGHTVDLALLGLLTKLLSLVFPFNLYFSFSFRCLRET